MPRTLTGQTKSSPVVNIRGKVGNYFKGILKSGPRVVRMKRGSGYVYEFAWLETNAPVQKKNEEGKFVDLESLEENAIVSIFAPTVLKGALDQAKIGETIYIEYLGTALNKTGTEFHNFKVEAL